MYAKADIPDAIPVTEQGLVRESGKRTRDWQLTHL